MSLLSQDAIEQRLSELSGWERQGGLIEKTVDCASFKEALFLVNTVAGLAEAANHHPDIDIRFRKVRLALTSHDKGGLTERDFSLAAAIEKWTA